MADCTKCASAPSCVRVWKGEDNPTCVGYLPIRTRIDWIRSMTAEELADFLRTHPWNAHGMIYADDRLIDWLRQEVTDGQMD